MLFWLIFVVVTYLLCDNDLGYCETFRSPTTPVLMAADKKYNHMELQLVSLFKKYRIFLDRKTHLKSFLFTQKSKVCLIMWYA